MVVLRNKYAKIVGLLEDARDALTARNREVRRYREALCKIRDERTERSQAKVQRMANIAQEALDY